MASGRRGGPPDLKSTLGSLLRTTLEQVGAVKDAVEQQARGRGGLIDQALEQRRRKDAMARLGEAVHRLAQSGELGELALDPKIGMCLEEIDALDADAGPSDGSDDDELYPPSRGEAVSSSSYSAVSKSEPGEYRVWRPTRSGSKVEAAAQRPSAHAPSSPQPAVSSVASPSKPTGRSARLPRKTAQRSGSAIQFVDDRPRPEDPESDDDLASYMHDDDVPEKI